MHTMWITTQQAGRSNGHRRANSPQNATIPGMASSAGRPGGPRPWSPIEKNLRKLHRHGLISPPLHELPALVEVARSISAAATDYDKVIDALARAIDASWGGATRELRSLRDTMRLCFGLPAVDDPEAPETRDLSSAKRHTSAWEHWVRPEHQADVAPKEALATFRTSKAQKRYVALAQRFVQLESEAAQSRLIRTPPVSGLSEPAPTHNLSLPAPDTSADPRGVHRSRQSRLDRLKAHRITRPLSTLLALVVVAGIVVAAWAPWSSARKPIPPTGAIVNAQTGAWSMTAPKTPVEFPTGIAEGGSVEVCDLSSDPKCRRVQRTGFYMPLKVRLGNTLAFAFQLNNGYTDAIPYLSLDASAEHTRLSRPSRLRVPKNVSEALRRTGEWSDLTMDVSVEWPSSGRLGSGPFTTRQAHIEGAFMHVTSPGSYALHYLPGTSTLQYKHPHFFHYLPNGIMGPGIALQDLGEPADCYPCDIKYIRWVYFKARVVKEPILANRRPHG